MAYQTLKMLKPWKPALKAQLKDKHGFLTCRNRRRTFGAAHPALHAAAVSVRHAASPTPRVGSYST